jgi:hypothetical protein
VEHQLEYVEVCCTDAGADAELALEDGERQGVARVVEAMHAHMWPGLVRKQQTGSHPLVPSQQQGQQQQQQQPDTAGPEHETHANAARNEDAHTEDEAAALGMDKYERLMADMAGVSLCFVSLCCLAGMRACSALQ